MAATAASEVSEGPVLNLINKRLRALRKKYNRILQMEESVSQGKTLNKEQEETLRSKPSVLGAIEELEKIRQPLSSALAEELQNIENSAAEQPTRNEEEQNPQMTHNGANVGGSEGMVEDLLNLLYFGRMFDVKSQSDFVATMYRKTHERGCCLTYDYVTDDDSADLLGERDLDLISGLSGLMISRPVDSSFSHKNALQSCIEHAKLWLANSEQPIAPESNITYAALRAKLNKIMASDYFTTTPELKASAEMAAAAENYRSFQVPVNDPSEVEGSAVQYEQKEEEVENSQHEVYDYQSGPVEELYQDVSEMESSCELQVENDSDEQQIEGQSSKDVDPKEQKNAPRRYQNYRGGRGGRGGGRRGYPNGRGGRGSGRGGYQNGRSQYYEEAGNYYPRNYYNYRGRGGRGGTGYNQAAVQGDRVPVNS